MDYERIFAISSAGMAVEKTRVQVAAMNIANAQTVSVAGSPAYQPLRVVPRAMPTPSFAQVVSESMTIRPQVDVVPDEAPPREVYDPSNPLASKTGFVSYPAVDTIAEMIRLMGATRAYESNLVVLNTAKGLALKTLDIGA